MKTSSPSIDEVDASSSFFPPLLSRVSLLVEGDNDDDDDDEDEDVDGSNSRRGKTINRNRVATSLIFSFLLAEKPDEPRAKINQRKKNRSGRALFALSPPGSSSRRPSPTKRVVEREREKKKARNLLFFYVKERSCLSMEIFLHFFQPDPPTRKHGN
jgi:hypothetical protein